MPAQSPALRRVRSQRGIKGSQNTVPLSLCADPVPPRRIVAALIALFGPGKSRFVSPSALKGTFTGENVNLPIFCSHTKTSTKKAEYFRPPGRTAAKKRFWAGGRFFQRWEFKTVLRHRAPAKSSERENLSGESRGGVPLSPNPTRRTRKGRTSRNRADGGGFCRLRIGAGRTFA